MVELLIDRVVITGDNVEICYAFPIGPAGESGRFCHLRIDFIRDPRLVRLLWLELPISTFSATGSWWPKSFAWRNFCTVQALIRFGGA